MQGSRLKLRRSPDDKTGETTSISSSACDCEKVPDSSSSSEETKIQSLHRQAERLEPLVHRVKGDKISSSSDKTDIRSLLYREKRSQSLSM